MIRLILGLLLIAIFIASMSYFLISKTSKSTDNQTNDGGPIVRNEFSQNPLSLESQKNKSYPGSEFVIERELQNGINYKQFVVSYLSDGYKIFGLLSIPTTEKPKNGYPAIIFNHGFIPPKEYRTTEKYVAYFGNFASNGYIVFKSDYRGHGDSQGTPSGAYFSDGYITDVLNGLSSVKKMEEVDTQNIGMWGHSLGGFLTLRSMVISHDIKAGVIWGGVVGSYQDMYEEWWSKRRNPNPQQMNPSNNSSRQAFVERYGQPTLESKFWNSISSTTYIKDISGPLQLHHGLSDETVPYQLSRRLLELMKNEGLAVELYEYEGNDHNLTQSFNIAHKRSVEFFDQYLKK